MDWCRLCAPCLCLVHRWPYCDFFDIAGLCDVRDALKACQAYPQECERYSQDPSR